MVLFNPKSLQRLAPHFAKPDAAWKVMLVAGVFLVIASSLGLMARLGRDLSSSSSTERIASSPRLPMTDAVVRHSPRQSLRLSQSQE